jgi:hypothetical protein
MSAYIMTVTTASLHRFAATAERAASRYVRLTGDCPTAADQPIEVIVGCTPAQMGLVGEKAETNKRLFGRRLAMLGAKDLADLAHKVDSGALKGVQVPVVLEESDDYAPRWNLALGTSVEEFLA